MGMYFNTKATTQILKDVNDLFDKGTIGIWTQPPPNPPSGYPAGTAAKELFNVGNTNAKKPLWQVAKAMNLSLEMVRAATKTKDGKNG